MLWCWDECWHPLGGRKKDCVKVPSAGYILILFYFNGIFILDSNIIVYS